MSRTARACVRPAKVFQSSVALAEEAVHLGDTERRFCRQAAKRQKTSDPIGPIEEVKAEGWTLQHAGYVFLQTGWVSRDKLLPSGQTAHVTGEVVGICVFRWTELAAFTATDSGCARRAAAAPSRLEGKANRCRRTQVSLCSTVSDPPRGAQFDEWIIDDSSHCRYAAAQTRRCCMCRRAAHTPPHTSRTSPCRPRGRPDRQPRPGGQSGCAQHRSSINAVVQRQR
jgi:hypothetical protein